MAIAINKVRLNLVISKESEDYIRGNATHGQALGHVVDEAIKYRLREGARLDRLERKLDSLLASLTRP
jgi:hypothetical protein